MRFEHLAPMALVALVALVACSHPKSAAPTAADSAAPPVASASATIASTETTTGLETKPDPKPQEPVRVEPIEVPGDQQAYALRGERSRAHPIVFLAGMCGHPWGYVQSFANSAADHGVAIGVQGEVACGGSLSSWSYDLERTNRRIDAAFAAAGEPAPHDAIVVGYSQGAERAEALAARWPEKYSRLVLIASPIDPKPQARAVLMAGDHDISKPRMRAAATRLGKRATFIPLAGARHGEMGPTPNDTMKKAFAFLMEP